MKLSVQKLLALLLVSSCGVSSAAVFKVTNTGDTGPGSLRQAILDNNSADESNIIEFDLTGAGPWTIRPQSGFLPALRGPVVLRPNAKEKPTGAESSRAAASGADSLLGLSPKIILDAELLVKRRTPSACPGATYNWNETTKAWDISDQKGTGPNVRGYYGAGLAVQDSHNVEITGIEIRGFCAGIAGVRSHDVYVHDVKITDSLGAAGIIFTGDDGKSGKTDLSFSNRVVHPLLLDNGDGMEFTRGTHDSILQDCYIGLTQKLPEDGNAFEFAQGGDNDTLEGNTFHGYTDIAVTVSGNNQTIRNNVFSDNKSGGLRSLTSSGVVISGNTFRSNIGAAIHVGGLNVHVTDNVITGNDQGILIANATVTISRNSIYDNKQAGIADAPPPAPRGGGGANRPGAPPPAQNAAPSAPPLSAVPEPPTLSTDSKWDKRNIMLHGLIKGEASKTYEVEVFVSKSDDARAGQERGIGEGEKFLGTAHAITDASGEGSFALPLEAKNLRGYDSTEGYFTATATDERGSTSAFSRTLHLSKQ